ncbi:hypothetical protein MFRU_003g03750 [Monilinia fructicola]|uniref:Rhodopsin domain-containing protein n=1 Tax=Monilinia fructicola TaxID=38448 RepID=A0A5M9JWC3_MONFR|nr:hypothetical protein EYC84_003021 [Monilinia fructicola]KAG4034410.1 hypothetical protein MFRU_003g03750 [Monilinia fructicola]
MQLPSLEILATWPKPNYVDPETRGKGVLIVNLILFPVALTIILIRLYTRLHISKSFGLDDWLIIAAMLPATTFAVLAVLAEEAFKFNRHIWDVPTSHVTFGLQFVLITQIVFTFSQTLTKCSMMALLYRILSNGKLFKTITIAATAMIAVQGTLFIIVVIFQCRPVSHYWLITFAPQPECINQTVHVTWAGSFNTFTDCVVVLFPIPRMLKLQISQRQRLVIIFLFAAGFLVCVAGAIRTYFTYKDLVSSDITWDTYYVWISSSIELYIGIIGASIPATKPFFKRLFTKPNLISSRNDHYVISSNGKGPFSESSTNATSRTSRTSRTISQPDIEMGDIRERDMRIKGQSNLDAIEEVRGSDTSISSFVNGQSERDRSRRGDDFKGHDVRLEIRDGGMTPRSDEMFDYRRDSKDELIEDVEKDMHVAIPGRAHLPRSSW